MNRYKLPYDQLVRFDKFSSKIKPNSHEIFTIKFSNTTYLRILKIYMNIIKSAYDRIMPVGNFVRWIIASPFCEPVDYHGHSFPKPFFNICKGRLIFDFNLKIERLCGFFYCLIINSDT